MKILAVEPGPHFSVADVHSGWVKALRGLGCNVANMNLGDRLDFYSQVSLKRGKRWRPALNGDEACRMASKGVTAAAFEMWPDVVVITSCFFVSRETLEVLRARGMKVVLLLTESPYEDDGQLLRAPYADVVLLNDPTNIDKFRDVNPNTHYIPHAYDPDVHYRSAPEDALRSDFCFVGTGFPSRINFLEHVDWAGIEFALGGNWRRTNEDSPLRKFLAHDVEECIDNCDAVRLYSNTKASANLYRREAERPELSSGWAMGPREVELAATGTFFLREPRGEGDDLFPFLPTFSSPGEFEEKLRWALDHDRERDRAAQRAREAIADRTFQANAQRLLNLL